MSHPQKTHRKEKKNQKTSTAKSKFTSDSKRSQAKPASGNAKALMPINSALEVKTLFLNTFKEEKVSLSFKNLINFSLLFVKFFCQLTTKHRNSKLTAYSLIDYTI